MKPERAIKAPIQSYFDLMVKHRQLEKTLAKHKAFYKNMSQYQDKVISSAVRREAKEAKII